MSEQEYTAMVERVKDAARSAYQDARRSDVWDAVAAAVIREMQQVAQEQTR
jgi:hypothetical protein